MLFLQLYDVWDALLFMMCHKIAFESLFQLSNNQMTIDMVLSLSFSNLKGSDANGHVQKALNALNVYDNIVKNIDDANITSLTTLNISGSTQDVSTSILFLNNLH